MAKKIRIGDVLRRARDKKKMTADEVAALCNVTRSRYYQWEQEDYILAKNIPGLAKALGLSENYLRKVNGGREPAEPGDAEPHAAA